MLIQRRYMTICSNFLKKDKFLQKQVVITMVCTKYIARLVLYNKFTEKVLSDDFIFLSHVFGLE